MLQFNWEKILPFFATKKRGDEILIIITWNKKINPFFSRRCAAPFVPISVHEPNDYTANYQKSFKHTFYLRKIFHENSRWKNEQHKTKKRRKTRYGRFRVSRKFQSDGTCGTGILGCSYLYEINNRANGVSKTKILRKFSHKIVAPTVYSIIYQN